MIYLRSDVRGAALHALLEALLAVDGAAVAGMRVERAPTGALAAALSAGGATALRREFPGGSAIDPVPVAEVPLVGAVDAVVSAFGASVFGRPRSAEVQYLYVLRAGAARTPLLTTISSECWASIALDGDAWAHAVRRDARLAGVVTTSEDAWFVDDHRIGDLWEELEAAEDDAAVADVLQRALHGWREHPHDAMAAAALVAEAAAATELGDLGWRLVGREVPGTGQLGVAGSAVRLLTRFVEDGAWRSSCRVERVGAAVREARRLLRGLAEASPLPSSDHAVVRARE